jgi:hypothetical protein
MKWKEAILEMVNRRFAVSMWHLDNTQVSAFSSDNKILIIYFFRSNNLYK